MIQFNKFGYCFRTVDEDDAEFILSLRTDTQLSRYLSHTNVNIDQQREWISKYKLREKNKQEYYFITTNEKGEKFGVARIYNFNDNTFESGSWLFSKEAPKGSAILGDLASRDFGFFDLGFNICRFTVDKQNKSIVNYSLSFKPKMVNEDETNYHFEIDQNTYIKYRNVLVRMLVKPENKKEK